MYRSGLFANCTGVKKSSTFDIYLEKYLTPIARERERERNPMYFYHVNGHFPRNGKINRSGINSHLSRWSESTTPEDPTAMKHFKLESTSVHCDEIIQNQIVQNFKNAL